MADVTSGTATATVSAAGSRPGPELEFGVHSEYGRLHAVVVGSVEGLAYPAWNRNVRYLPDEIRQLLSEPDERGQVDVRERAPAMWEALRDDVEGVVSAFEAEGVTVLRPRPYKPLEREYLANLQGGHSLLYPADPTYVVGRHVIETCIRRPFRRKETWATRDVLAPFIAADPEVRHVSIPRAAPGVAGDEGPGPFLEGGDIIICGQDVLCGVTDLTSNAAGAEWLRRYLEPFGYRVHPVHVTGTWLHLLSVLTLVREGLVMAYLPALGGRLPEPVAGWDVIEMTEEEARGLAAVGMNLDQERHLIDRRLERIIGELDRHGMTPIPIAIDTLAKWGGAIRCVAMPFSREAD
jgi:glycine amidinotransferase